MKNNLDTIENKELNILTTKIVYFSKISEDLKEETYEKVCSVLEGKGFISVVKDKPQVIYSSSSSLKKTKYNKELLKSIFESITENCDTEIEEIEFLPQKH